MKRFTETDKWRDSWFRKLPPDQKLAYLHAIDSCDACGVWEADYELAEFMLGCKPNWPALLDALGGRVTVIEGGKWFFTRFIAFQYGELSQACKPHLNVFRCLNGHGLLKDYSKGFNALEEKEKEKEKEQEEEKEKEKETDKTAKPQEREPALRLACALFGKRDTTPLDRAEQTAWKTAKPLVLATSEAEWLDLRTFYAAKMPKANDYRRRNLATLLNNWSGELSKARAWATQPGGLPPELNQF